MAKDPAKVKQGRKNRAAGSAFERRVRADLEQSWIIDRWTNNLEVVKYDNEEGNFSGEIKVIPAKTNMFGARNTGFPDFISYRNCIEVPHGKSIIIDHKCESCGRDARIVEFKMNAIYEVIGVECKINGNLDKIEKEKCRWYLDNGTFSKILIASKIKEGRKIKIVYTDFAEKYDYKPVDKLMSIKLDGK